MYMQTPIMSDMAFPDRKRPKLSRKEERERLKDPNRLMRLGYIRQGQKVPVLPEVRRLPNCAEGWYELVQGGFVCGRYATVDINHPRVRLAPHPPELDQALPYVYGVNLTNGTPLYYSVPTQEDRSRLEPPPRRKREDNPYEDPSESVDNGDAGTPWYLREHDGGKPQVTLDELRGEDGGPLVRRMVRGFFIALDAEVKVKQTKWWKTTYGYVVAQDRIAVHKPLTDFHGLWLNTPTPPPYPPPIASVDPPRGPIVMWNPAALGAVVSPTSPSSPSIVPTRDALASSDGSTAAPTAAGATALDASTGVRPITLPVGFVLNPTASRYAVAADGSSAARTDPIARHTAVPLTGRSVLVGKQSFDQAVDGSWLRALDTTKTKPGPPPKDLAPGEKWIDVNLTTQTLVAFEGDVPVYATLVSSGKQDPNDPGKDFRTPTGSFRIREKHVAATMDGDVVSDGPYSIEDVPWIMYFEASYALHGAFWHSSFGRTRSHGCVNLSPADARAIFFWSDPPLPDQWHAVAATPSRPGTRIIVHE
jgi:lipoprotein-anchoring transpeptidase ErfK/SrfK